MLEEAKKLMSGYRVRGLPSRSTTHLGPEVQDLAPVGFNRSTCEGKLPIDKGEDYQFLTQNR